MDEINFLHPHVCSESMFGTSFARYAVSVYRLERCSELMYSSAPITGYHFRTFRESAFRDLLRRLGLSFGGVLDGEHQKSWSAWP